MSCHPEQCASDALPLRRALSTLVAAANRVPAFVTGSADYSGCAGDVRCAGCGMTGNDGCRKWCHIDELQIALDMANAALEIEPRSTRSDREGGMTKRKTKSQRETARWEADRFFGRGDSICLRTVSGAQMASVWPNGTWHTWDADGVGGENSHSPTVAEAKSAAIAALERQNLDPVKGWKSHRPFIVEREGDTE